MNLPDLKWLTPGIEQVQAHHRRCVAALYDGEAPNAVVAIAGRFYGASHGLLGTNEPDMLQDSEAWLDDVLTDMAQHADEFADEVTFRPAAIELDPLGVHFIDALLGADVCYREGQVWSAPLDCDVAELPVPDLSRSQHLRNALRLAELATKVAAGRLLVALPVFSCAINIGINVFGQRLLEALVERPEAARRALGIINSVILHCIRAFSEVVPEELRRNSVACERYAPPGFGQIDGCATQLVSRPHYAEFFAPPDQELLGAWPHGGMIHLCGAHEQHIGTWRRMECLRSVQTNDRASDDLELLHTGLRPDQVLYVGPTETTTVERILEITGGRRLVLQCPLAEPTPVPCCGAQAQGPRLGDETRALAATSKQQA